MSETDAALIEMAHSWTVRRQDREPALFPTAAIGNAAAEAIGVPITPEKVLAAIRTHQADVALVPL